MNPQIQQDLDYIFQKTNHLVGELNGKTILLTGGTGFIGKWLLEYFLYLNLKELATIRVLIISRNPQKFLENYPRFNVHFFTFLSGDLINMDFKMVPSADLIIHAAASTDAKLNLEQPLLSIDTIIDGTRNILKYGAEIQSKKILFLSSGAVYGTQPEGMVGFTEDYSGGPELLSSVSAYSESKRTAELLCACFKSQCNLDVSIARCFAFVGPYLPLDKHFAIGNFINNGLNGEDITIKGNGKPLRSYMYTADLVIWLMYILLKGENGTAYNVGSDVAISIKELAKKISKYFPEQSVKVLGQFNTTDRNQDYVPSVKKIRSGLSVPEILELGEAVERTIKFHLSHE